MIMKFFGFEPGPEATPDAFSEISSQEVLKLDEKKYPYQSLVRVFDGNENAVFQGLENRDDPEVGLSDYRSEEVDEILGNLETSKVCSLVAPSRSGKTEAVMLAEQGAFETKNTLLGKTNGYFFDVAGSFGTREETDPDRTRNGLKRKIEDANEGLQRNRVALLDEFIPVIENHITILEYLLEQDFKCVITQGGFLSNDTKKDLIESLSSRLGVHIPVTEMGIKPLNQRQILELYEGKSHQRSEDSASAKLLAKLSAEIPMPLHIAIGLLHRSDEISAKIIWNALNDRYSGVYSIKQIKEAVKRKQTGQFSR